MLHAERRGTNRMHSDGRPGKIISFCAGVRDLKPKHLQIF